MRSGLSDSSPLAFQTEEPVGSKKPYIFFFNMFLLIFFSLYFFYSVS